MTNDYAQDLTRQIKALMALGFRVMPTILDKDNPKLENGKVPSYLSSDGRSLLITGRKGWSVSDLQQQIELASKIDKPIGIAVQPTGDLYIVDLDVQNYDGRQEELLEDYQRLISQHPPLKDTRTERTQNGGLHIYLRVRSVDSWKQEDGRLRMLLTTSAGGHRRGELISSNKVCIAAPSYGKYKLHCVSENIITVDTLESHGVFPFISQSPSLPKSNHVHRPAATVQIRDLLGLKSKRVLEGEFAFSDCNTPKQDRSLQLTGFAKDAYGVENFLRDHSIQTQDSADELIAEVAEKFSLDDKVDRVLSNILPSRLDFKPSSISFIRQKLGLRNLSTTGKRNITADIARDAATKILGPFRQRLRTGEIIMEDGSIINLDKASRMYLRLSADSDYNWSKQIAKDTIVDIAEENQFDHIKEDILALAEAHEPLPDQYWERLDQFLFGIDHEVAAMFMPKYLIGALTRLLEPGCPYVPTPILIGGQGSRKSDLVKALFGDDYVTQGISPHLTKEDASKLHRFWALELAEVDGFMKKSDREKLKEFLTITVDTYRPVWKESEVTRPRAFIFWGNANSAPLEDPTGNRRFVAISLEGKSHATPLPVDKIRSHRGQLWSRVLAEYRKGNSYHFTAEEQSLVNQCNLENTRIDSWQERLSERLSLDPKHTYLTLADTFEILRVDVSQQNKVNQDRLRHVLSSLGYAYKKISLSDGTRCLVYVRKSGRGTKHERVSVYKCQTGNPPPSVTP